MYPKDFFEQQKLPIKNGQCFVLMPFAAGFDEVYEVIKTTVEGPELGFSCHRADQLFGGGHIIVDILRCLAQSELVIADLTTKNPNVFYELGIAHTVKNLEKVLILTQDIGDVPFDLRPFRCITYEQNEQGLRGLRKHLVSAVREVAKAAFRFSVDHNGRHKFERLLSGADRCFYHFEIPELWTGVDAVKFRLQVYRHVLGHPAESVHDDTHFLACEASLTIPGLSWNLVVESIAPRQASFRVVATDTVTIAADDAKDLTPAKREADWTPLLAGARELTVRLLDLSNIYRGGSELPFTQASLHADFCEMYCLRRDPIVNFDECDPDLLRSDERAVQRVRMRMAYELTYAVTALSATAKYLALAERTRRDLRERRINVTESTRAAVLELLSRVRECLQGDAGIFEEQQDAIGEMMWGPTGAIISSAEFRDKLLKPGWEHFTMLFRFFVHFQYKLEHEVKQTLVALDRLTAKLDDLSTATRMGATNSG